MNIIHSNESIRKINDEQEKVIVESITTKTPEDVGFESKKNWNIKLIRQFVIEEFNIAISYTEIAYVFHSLNLSYTITTYIIAKAYKEKQ